MTQVSSFLQVFRDQARDRPDSLLLSVDGVCVGRGEFVHDLARVRTAVLRAGGGEGATVAIILPNGKPWYTLFWAIVAAGGVPVPLDPQVGEWELRQLLAVTAPSLVVTCPRFRSNDLLRSIAVLRPEIPSIRRVVVVEAERPSNTSLEEAGAETWTDFLGAAGCGGDWADPVPGVGEPLMYACTSGTTGASRVIVVPHEGFLRSQADMAHYLGLGPTDRMLLGMPLYHQGGLGMGLQAVLAGGAAVYASRFEPRGFLQAAVDMGATALQLSPTLAKILLSTPDVTRYDLSRVRLVYFAGEVLPDDVARAFWAERHIRVVNIIGSSETGTMVVWDSDVDSARPPGEFRELSFTAARLVGPDGLDVPDGETGDLLVRTDAVLTAYLGNPTESAARIRVEGDHRWFVTGDLGVRLPDGRIRFMGRAKRVIKRGGNLVYPEEVEAFLLSHPLIAAVAVVKEDNELFGEAIVAHVQPAPGASLTRGDLLKFCRGRLAAYKIPDTVLLTPEIPSGIGKIQYKYLRQPREET